MESQFQRLNLSLKIPWSARSEKIEICWIRNTQWRETNRRFEFNQIKNLFLFCCTSNRRGRQLWRLHVQKTSGGRSIFLVIFDDHLHHPGGMFEKVSFDRLNFGSPMILIISSWRKAYFTDFEMIGYSGSSVLQSRAGSFDTKKTPEV